MQFRKCGDKYILRFKKGDEIVETLKDFCRKEKITFASVTAIGASESLTVGAYSPKKQEYNSIDYEGEFEILNISGNVSQMNNDVYLHLHMTISDHTGHAFGGHLNRAIVNPTCEMVLSTVDTVVDRYKDPETGLNVLDA